MLFIIAVPCQGDPKVIYNHTTHSMNAGCVTESMAQYQGGDLVLMLNIFCPALILALIGLSMLIRRLCNRNAKKKKRDVGTKIGMEVGRKESEEGNL